MSSICFSLFKLHGISFRKEYGNLSDIPIHSQKEGELQVWNGVTKDICLSLLCPPQQFSSLVLGKLAWYLTSFQLCLFPGWRWTCIREGEVLRQGIF